MEYLQFCSLLLINKDYYKNCFESYFKTVYLVKDNTDAIKIYAQEKPSVLFLDFHEKKLNGFEAIKKIHKLNQNCIIVLLADSVSKEELIDACFFKLSGCIVQPFQKEKIEQLLINIDYELFSEIQMNLLLKNGYSYHLKYKTLYNEKHQKVSLTKNEMLLLEVLLNNKNQWIDSTIIGYHIWGDVFFEKDCNGRLKTLITSIRKKLPKNMINNNYAVGYMIEIQN